MNIEFHYFITHLIAARAGLRGDDLRVFAYSSQYTDDNQQEFRIKGPKRQRVFQGRYYHNRISQTMNILKPHDDKLSIYPLFHFIPGEKDAPTAGRKDGAVRPFNTTPDSPNANHIIDAMFASKNLYAMGIASHAYVDTWAHQNWVGYKDSFNGLSGKTNAIIPNIGHADGRHNPDWVGLIWNDERLADPTANNRKRFLDAAEALFRKLRTFIDSSCSPDRMDTDIQSLRSDIDAAIGPQDDKNDLFDARIKRYQKLALQPEYGEAAIPDYKEEEWFETAVKRIVRHSPAANGQKKTRITYRFKGHWQNSDWFKFQQSVKTYADTATAILKETLDFTRDTRPYC